MGTEFPIFDHIKEEKKGVMKMECDFCGRTAGLGKKRTADGVICGDCAKKLPKLIEPASMTSETLYDFMKYEDRLKQTEFTESAEYKGLKIDNRHGLIACDGAVFYCLDLTDFAIFCDNVKGGRTGVICDVMLELSVAMPDMQIKKKLAGGEHCSYKRISNSQVQWVEPSEVSVIRSMVMQMIRTENEKYATFCNENYFSKPAVDAMQAQFRLLLPDGYTADDVRKHRDVLLGAFAGFGDEYDDIIRLSADVLLNRINKEDGEE